MMAGAKGRSGGHNRKTSQKLASEGGYRKSRHGQRVDARVPGEQISPPSHLTELGIALWNRVIGSLPRESITKIDADALSAYCDMAELYSLLRPIVMADPLDKDARITFMNALDRMDKLGRQFGWTPQSRAGLASPQAEQEEDPFEAIVSRMARG